MYKKAYCDAFPLKKHIGYHSCVQIISHDMEGFTHVTNLSFVQRVHVILLYITEHTLGNLTLVKHVKNWSCDQVVVHYMKECVQYGNMSLVKRIETCSCYRVIVQYMKECTQLRKLSLVKWCAKLFMLSGDCTVHERMHTIAKAFTCTCGSHS